MSHTTTTAFTLDGRVIQSAITAASASIPARQSARSANSAGECDTPVGLRTNSIALGNARRQHPCVVAGAGAELGHPANTAQQHTTHQTQHQRPSRAPDGAGIHVGQKSTAGEIDSGCDGQLDALGGGACARVRSTPCTIASTAWSGAARVEPRRHPRRDRVRAVRLDVHASERRDATLRMTGRPARATSTVAANGSIGSCRSANRVVPAWFASPAKVNRHRPCGQIPVPIPTGASRSTSESALFDVQLDEDTHPAQQPRRHGPAAVCRCQRDLHRGVERHAVDVGQRARRIRRQRADAAASLHRRLRTAPPPRRRRRRRRRASRLDSTAAHAGRSRTTPIPRRVGRQTRRRLAPSRDATRSRTRRAARPTTPPATTTPTGCRCGRPARQGHAQRPPHGTTPGQRGRPSFHANRR